MGKAARQATRAKRSRESASPLISSGPAIEGASGGVPATSLAQGETKAPTVGVVPHVAGESSLRAIEQALCEVEDARTGLAERVRAAHADGHSWGTIAQVLGVTRQTAHARFRD